MRRRVAFAALGCVLLATMPSAAAETFLDCGEFAPFNIDCVSEGRVYHGGQLTLSAAMFTFIGQMDVRVTGRTSGAELHWTCWSIAAPTVPGSNPPEPLLSGCSGPTWNGTPFLLNELLDMYCNVSPTHGPGLPGPGLGPFGSWGCKVAVPDSA
jgi:hypothetical protein